MGEPRCENQGLTVGHSHFLKLGETLFSRVREFKEQKMQKQNGIRVQQAQQGEKPKKTKRVAWILFTRAAAIGKFVYRVWQFIEGDSDS